MHSKFGQVALGAALCLMTSACFGPEHPNTKRYEYLYIDGSFVPPHHAFPEGVERNRWQCYDRKTKATFSCTFVRGGFEHFQYVFRERT